MAQQSPQQEPTMEEILASIRRIISEDSDEAAPAVEAPAPTPAPAPAKAAAPAPAPAAVAAPAPEPEEEVLELTQVVEEEAVLEPEPILEPDPIPEPVRPKPAARPKPVVVEEEDVVMVDRDTEEETLLSPATSSALSNAFGQLQANMHVASDPSVTLEEIVRGLLKPLLKEWLDEHLPPLAERLVREEIERVSRGGAPTRR